MHRMTLVLAYMCTTFANFNLSSDNRTLISYRRLPQLERTDTEDSEPLNKKSKYSKESLDSYLKWEASVKTPTRPKRPRVKPEKKTINFKPPRYFKALDDFDDAVYDIRLFLKPDDKYTKFISFYYYVQFYAMHVARDGWKSTNNDIEADVNPNIDIAIAQINCYLDTANRVLRKVRNTLTSDWVNLICSDKRQEQCDALIYGMVDLKHDKNFNREIDILLTLGYAASFYMRYYADDVLKWALLSDVSGELMTEAKGAWFRNLVSSEADVHRKIFGRKKNCFQ